MVRFYVYAAELTRNELRLIFLLMDLFEVVEPFKSELYHASDLTFYLVCRGFRRPKFEKEKVLFKWLNTEGRAENGAATRPQ